MCDRIREGDERNLKIFENKEITKCLEINLYLEKCLENFQRDFRKCKKEVNDLKECMNKKNSNINN